MKKLIRYIDHFEEVVSSSLLITVVVLMFSQVVLRYVFGKSLAWSEEVAQMAFLCMVYVATALAAKQGAHIRVTAHLKYLPKTIRNLMILAGNILWILFDMVVVWQGIVLVQSMVEHPMKSAALEWDMAPLFAVIPLAFALQIIRIIQQTVTAWRSGQELAVDEGDSYGT